MDKKKLLRAKNRYFIKEGYKARSINLTLDVNRRSSYWAGWRIQNSYYYQYAVYVLAKKTAQKHRIQSVLDIGCGRAKKLMFLIAPHVKEIVGVDQESSVEYCKKAYKDKNATFVVEDLETPKCYLNRKFGLILAIDVIEHLLYPDRLLKYIKKHASRDTMIILSTPERDIRRGIDCMCSPKPEHVREWNKYEFVALLDYYGYEIIHIWLVNRMKCDFSKQYLKERLYEGHRFKCCLAVLCKIRS